ncbi:hypothetical protein FMM05_18030 [Flavobacterium zepuense]|uniref:Outer membrane protein beta-barrel domain-containing protein n=1 Tax=Flavobacterium zepuense TaxID=2593302 RepID=A0A552UVZ9_9FLAO|nr:hypothetical protein [Flavobacterium zepuense]TRW22402.1 hypothetical protein FMM05_18030 [Flavobacterium zepuense]
MKNTLLALLFTGFAFNASAQTAETTTTETASGMVEKSIINVQTGAVGLWGSYEGRLSNRWALRAEVGLDLWFYEAYEGYSFANKKTGSFLAPSVSVEPRWYYNIEKRARKGKYSANNSASFVTVAIKYYPDLFKIGGPDYLYVPNQISIIPKWGIRRSIAKSNFNYELGFGIGYLRYLDDSYYYSEKSDVAIDVHARIGYTF